MRDLVGRGGTRPLSWRLDQLNRLRALVEENEQELLAALASDLGKPQTEAFFEVVTLLQEAKQTVKNLHRWMRPRSVPLPLTRNPGVPPSSRSRLAVC